MTSQPELKISMVNVRVPVDLPPSRRRSQPENPDVALEVWADSCRVWDGAGHTLCGETYSYADTATSPWSRRGYDQLPDIPYFDQVYRYLVDQHAANRGNPLGKFLANVVEAMDRAVCERTGSRVYFAQAGDRIKIGWSRNVATRIATLQTANADPLHLLATVPGARSLERQLHERFAAARLSGEWFEATPDLLAYIGSLQSAG